MNWEDYGYEVDQKNQNIDVYDKAGMNHDEFIRLNKSIEWSNMQMQPFRDERIESVEKFAGSHYGKCDKTGEGEVVTVTPTNFLSLAVCVHVRKLVPRAPRAMCTTTLQHIRPDVNTFELAVNQVPREIRLTDTLRRAAAEMLFSMCILKVGLADSGDVQGQEYGSTFVDNITIDNYFWDMSAKTLDEIQYEGNDYWAIYDDVKSAKWMPKGLAKELKPDAYTTVKEDGSDRADSISVDTDPVVYRDRIHLRDVWLPDKKMVVTYAVTQKKLLRVVKWKGPKNGPYYKKWFIDIPGNLMPGAPVQIWQDMHDLGNVLFRKLADQADSEKTVAGFPGGQEEDAVNHRKCPDGGAMALSGGTPTKIATGGVNGKTLAFFLQTRDLFSYFAGNLDSLAGLGAMSDTVGQDQLMSASANAQISGMADRMSELIRDVFEAIAWYELNDPIRIRTVEKRIPGTKLVVPVEWNREKRKRFKFEMVDINVDVYSLQDDSPSAMFQKLRILMQEFAIPLEPLMRAAGGTLNAEEIWRSACKYIGAEELADIYTFMEPQPGQEQGGDQEQGMPQNTTRTYERVNKSGQGASGNSGMMQALMSEGNQGSDMG
jgi:hypothetical protein